MLTRRETCCFHSLLVFLTEKCSIALGCAQQYAARMLEANGIYSLDMLLATWNADAGYWKSVAGSNQSHIKSAEKELHIMRARVMQLAQYPDLPLEVMCVSYDKLLVRVIYASSHKLVGVLAYWHALILMSCLAWLCRRPRPNSSAKYCQCTGSATLILVD